MEQAHMIQQRKSTQLQQEMLFWSSLEVADLQELMCMSL